MNTSNKFDSFKKTNIFRYPQSSILPNTIFINKVLEIVKSFKQPVSSSTLRMKLGDCISKENLPPSGKFNEWMSMIKELVRDDTIQVDMPYYSFPKQTIPVSQPKINLPAVSPIVVNQSESDKKLHRTINRVKVKYEDWVVEWNKFNTEDPSIEQWNKLYEKYNDLNKKIQTIKNFFSRHQELIKEYHPINMPKKPSDTIVYNVTKTEPVKIEPVKIEPVKIELVKTELIFEEPKPTLQLHSYLFPNTYLSPSHPHSIPPPPPPPPPPGLPHPPPGLAPPGLPSLSQSLHQYSENIYSNVHNNSNLFPKSYEHPNDQFKPQIPNEYMNIFENKDLYFTLVKLRNYGLMESNSLAEKAFILFEQNKKF